MNHIVDYNLDEDYTYLDCMVELEKMIRDVYVLSEDYLFGLDISNKELQFAHEVRKCMIISIDEYDEMPEDIVDKLAGSSTEKITVLVRQIREHSHSRDIMFYFVFGYLQKMISKDEYILDMQPLYDALYDENSKSILDKVQQKQLHVYTNAFNKLKQEYTAFMNMFM